jgi:alpha-1,2-mannosyltransferase
LKLGLDFLSESKALLVAVGLWILFALIVGGLVAARPDHHTVTPEYRQASEKWWGAMESPYDLTQVGYLYLPQEAILYTPFRILPKPLGEPLWRWVGLGILASGLWMAAGLIGPGSVRVRRFLWATALVIPAALSSARNGQVNLPLAGLLLLAASDLAVTRWNRASLWLLLAVMLKPIALAPALLAAACYPALRIRIALGFLLCLAAAWIHPAPVYVLAEYGHFWTKFLLAGQPLIKDNFSDFFGMFWHWGLHPAPSIISSLRALAAVGTLLLSLHLSHRFRGSPGMCAFGIMLVAALFLMLFNPRTEENSYVMLAGFTALLAARDLVFGNYRRGIPLAILCVMLAVENMGPVYTATRIWFKPLVTLIFLTGLLISDFHLLELSREGDSDEDFPHRDERLPSS